MKQLNNYIIEKLKINKDSEYISKEYNIITDKYSVGDICLEFINKGHKNNEQSSIEVVKITKRTKTKIEYEYIGNLLTNFKLKKDIKLGSTHLNELKHYNYAHTSGTSTSRMIISQDDCAEVLEKIKNDGYKFDFYANLFPNWHSQNLVKVVKLSDLTKWNNPEYNDYVQINDNDYKNIKSLIR